MCGDTWIELRLCPPDTEDRRQINPFATPDSYLFSPSPCLRKWSRLERGGQKRVCGGGGGGWGVGVPNRWPSLPALKTLKRLSRSRSSHTTPAPDNHFSSPTSHLGLFPSSRAEVTQLRLLYLNLSYFTLFTCPQGLTFTLWGCCGLCL